MGGYCINEGLSKYVTIDIKPDDICKIHKYSHESAKFMLQLKLVNTAEEKNKDIEEDDSGITHVSNVLLELTKPCLNKFDIMVLVYIYFSLVTTAKFLDRKGLGFVGFVKASTKNFPMSHLTVLDLYNHGE